MPQVPKSVSPDIGVKAASRAVNTAGSIVSKVNISIPKPSIPLPPSVARQIPSRTLSGLVPNNIRELLLYAKVAQQALPGQVKGTVTSASAAKQLPVSKSGLGSTPPFLPAHTRTPLLDAAKTYADPRVRVESGYLIDTFDKDAKGEKLYFQYNPEEVSIEKQAGWVVTPMPGRSHPFIQWGGGQAKHIKFALKFAYTQNEIGNVADNVNWISSFASPESYDPSSGLVKRPRVLGLYLGKMLGAGVQAVVVPVVLISYKVTYGGTDQLVRFSDLSPLMGRIDLEFVALLRKENGVIETARAVKTEFYVADAMARSGNLAASETAALLAGRLGVDV